MMLVKILATVITGTVLGLGITYGLVAAGASFDEISAGAWTRRPQSGSLDIDPYAHAVFARRGELPLGKSEGLSFVARQDSAGAPLRGRCDYVISGPIPPTHFWTLSLYSPSGALVANKAKRFGFTSAEILRAADGSFEITVSRHARPGNWLPIGKVSHFVLVLRLYDTLFDIGMAKVEAMALPEIKKGQCS